MDWVGEGQQGRQVIIVGLDCRREQGEQGRVRKRERANSQQLRRWNLLQMCITHYSTTRGMIPTLEADPRIVSIGRGATKLAQAFR